MISGGGEVILSHQPGAAIAVYPCAGIAASSPCCCEDLPRASVAPQTLVGKQVKAAGAVRRQLRRPGGAGLRFGLDANQVTLQSIGFTQAQAISRGQVDAALDYVVNGLRCGWPEEITVIPVSDYVDLPSNGIITNEQTIQAQPELVRLP